MANKPKDTRITFRTYNSVESKLDQLAELISKNKYSFGWGSPIKKCDSKSGIITEILAENITFDEIRNQLSEVEK